MLEEAKRDVRRYCSRRASIQRAAGSGWLTVCMTAPSLQAVLVYRFGAWVHRSVRVRAVRVPLKLAYMVASGVYSALWGVDIDPEAVIGGGLFLSHPRGILIGPVHMGADCNIGSHVTLGRRANGTRNAPIIGDRVSVGAGSVVFGKIRIGDDVTIGPRSVVGRSVPPNVSVAGNPIQLVHQDDVEVSAPALPVNTAPDQHAPAA